MTIEIFMPFYGDKQLLREAVESVLVQDDPDWRLVVLDDCYPDPDAARWVGEVSDPRVTMSRSPHNLGVSGTFQLAVDRASEDWLTIMGCDDRLMPGYVGQMKRAIAQFPHAGYIQPGVQVVDANGAPSRPLPDRIKDIYRPVTDRPDLLGGADLIRSLMRGNWTYFPSICWRRDLIAAHGFRPELEVVLDLALQVDLITDGHTMVLDPEKAFEYRRHADSVSSWSAVDGSRFNEEKALFLRTATTVRALGWRRAAWTARIHFSSRLNALSRLPAAIRNGRASDVRQLMRHALTNRLAR